MWLYGAEKLQWSVGEAEADAERAGCFAEQQIRLGLVVDGATPKTRDRFGRPVKRTTERLRTRIEADARKVGVSQTIIETRNYR